VVIEHLILQ